MSLVISQPAVSLIGSPATNHQVVSVDRGGDGVTIKPLGFFERLWHWKDSNFHQKRLSRLASVVAKVISVQPRLSIAAAAEDSTLKSARNLLKYCRKEGVRSPAIRNLEKEVVAAKLGISAITLDSNPGLQKFARIYHLERYLLTYNNCIKVHPDTQEASLLKEGEYQPWKRIFKASQSWTKPTHTPQLSWVYGPEGIQNKDMYDWTELKPFLKGDPADWNNEYIFEFCACFNPSSIKNGNHSWLRLKTPTGDVYSVGLYEPGKGNIQNNLNSPLRVKPAFLMQPDVSEFWDFPITTIGFKISEADFLKIKQTVEKDKNEENLIFQLFNCNCVLYGKKLALLAGVDMPAREHILELISPKKINRRITAVLDRLPIFMQKTSFFAAAFFLNLIQTAFGSYKVDGKLNKHQKRNAVPHMRAFRDLFDTNKVYAHLPTTLAFKTAPQVDEWRKKEIEALKEMESDPELRVEKEKIINLTLPPSYYSNFITDLQPMRSKGSAKSV